MIRPRPASAPTGPFAARIAIGYALAVTAVGIGTLIALFAGKDSVATWLLLLITLPLSLLTDWAYYRIPFDSVPDPQRWLIPVGDAVIVMVTGWAQAVILWRLLRGRPHGPNR
ncbi:hypothetical protein J5X84_37495 [Streptosporangiaceae bacterium NEAU-GS5]|nr:hypothetical protein [Streptosporangiaceae bacterium NEAU-GS5]